MPHHRRFPLLPSPSSMRAAANSAHFPASGRRPAPEACSAFTRVAARMVATDPRSASNDAAPIATGWSAVCRAGFAPADGAWYVIRNQDDRRTPRGPGVATHS